MSSIDEKVRHLISCIGRVEADLARPDILKDPKRYRSIYKEYKRLTQIETLFNKIEKLNKEIPEVRELIKNEADPEMVEFLTSELETMSGDLEKSELNLKTTLVPADPDDSCNTILELRAGTGGKESMLFVADCVKMYTNYAVNKGWKVEVLSQSPAEGGGLKSYCMVISGEDVYKHLRHEAGTHRVQRIPVTESQGRVHTSAITVSSYREPDTIENFTINDNELRIDTYRSSGAGGQHVNTTDSAVRITHIPTNIVVTCQDERSQHKNKAKALRVMHAKVLQQIQSSNKQEINDLRQEQIGSGDRSEKIRTYNFPQNRITDHRIKFTAHNLDAVMAGDLSDLMNHIIQYFSQAKLEAWLNSPN